MQLRMHILLGLRDAETGHALPELRWGIRAAPDSAGGSA
jgi:hypothetical protein